jgi:hypothetical protein
MASTKTRTGRRGRRSPGRSRPRRWEGFPTWALVVSVAAVVVVLVVVARPESGTDTASGAGQGLAHVHGLGINPADENLYAATHFGLFRVLADGKAERVGDGVQDTMGFAVVGPDHFLASGHPGPNDDRLRRPGQPPLLGLVESTDGGRSWQPVSLLGEADFHSLVTAHGSVYGYDATRGRFMVSADGKEWETRSQLRMGDVAVAPDDAAHLVATTQSGVAESRDGGRTWDATDGPQLAFLSWSARQGLWGVAPTGETYRRIDGRWDPRATLSGQPQALLVTGKEIYAAVSRGDGTAIYVSVDEGSSWRLRYSEGG